MSAQTGDPVPSIPEAEADGEIAALYADIRDTLGVPVVNLIWRNLATIPNGLQWAWTTAKPLYASGAIYAEGYALRTEQGLPALPVLSAAALEAVGVTADGRETIRRILDSYDRSNPLNLLALLVLLGRLNGEDAKATPRAIRGVPERSISGELPALLALADMAPATASLVGAVNRLGAGGDDHILVSMPRHLAHWPGYLALYWTSIAPLDADGRLGDSIGAVLADGRRRAQGMAGYLDGQGGVEGSNRAALEAALDDFIHNAISRMIPVVSLLKHSFPED
jgi:hypothetical protein